jgi:ribonuclease P protein component
LRTPRLINQDTKRFGFVVSKKATRTVAHRNRIKRILRALVQKSQKEFQDAHDYILQAKKNINFVSRQELRNEYDALIKKLHARL